MPRTLHVYVCTECVMLCETECTDMWFVCLQALEHFNTTIETLPRSVAPYPRVARPLYDDWTRHRGGDWLRREGEEGNRGSEGQGPGATLENQRKRRQVLYWVIILLVRYVCHCSY